MKGILAGLAAGLAACAMFGGASVAAYADTAPPAPGNSVAAQECQNGGWQNLVTSTYTPFANEGDCVAYAAQGGVLTEKIHPSYYVLRQGTFGGAYICNTEVDFSGFVPSTTYTLVQQQTTSGYTYTTQQVSDQYGGLTTVIIDYPGTTYTVAVLDQNGQTLFTTAPITNQC